MDIQKTLLATLAGFVGLFGLGYLIYVLIMPSPPILVAGADAGNFREYIAGIIAFEVLYSLLLVIIFGRWAGIKTLNTGLKAGALIGLLLGLCTGLWNYSTFTLFNPNVIWWMALTFALRFAVAGGLIAWVLGREVSE